MYEAETILLAPGAWAASCLNLFGLSVEGLQVCRHWEYLGTCIVCVEGGGWQGGRVVQEGVGGGVTCMCEAETLRPAPGAWAASCLNLFEITVEGLQVCAGWGRVGGGGGVWGRRVDG